LKLLVAFALSLFLLNAQDPRPWPSLQPVLVASGFDYPVDIQSPLDGSGRLFIVEQPGRILIHQNGQTLPTPEVWATGLRNPWRYSFDPETHDLWIADVGQNRLEEIDFQPASAAAGLNYGWNLMEGSTCYRPGCNQAGLTLPIFEYGRTLGVSVTGGYVYRGSVYPDRQGIYFFADFGSGRFWGLRREGELWASRELALLDGWAISTFGQAEDGELYFATHASRDGAVYRLADASPVTLRLN
jgi:glucose/arabinose dehydrogenase